MTVLEIIQRSAEYLGRKGVESPRLQVELLLAQLLKLPRLQLYLNFERRLGEAELAVMREWVRRRGNREPLQHLLGTTSFCGLELEVNPNVLIPRPETEGLAERAWTYLSGREGELTGLDVGTGSGCLAITLAVKCPRVRMVAVDVSAAALEVARANAVRHGVVERVEFRWGDGVASLGAGETFDVLVANPPYIPTADLAGLEAEVRDHDPRLALDGGPDGLSLIRRLAAEAGACLRRGGRLFLEFGDGQGEAVRELFRAQGWGALHCEQDLSGRERILVAEHA